MLKRNKEKIILIGYKSFIQKNLYNYLKKNYSVKKLKFKEVKKKNIQGYDVIINCSNSKNFFNKKYAKKYDRNLKIAEIVKKTGAKFYFLSSRQVYSQKLYLTEKSKIEPSNIYSKNCVISEKSCKKILKNNLLILRLSNVFGLENKRKNKPSLISFILIGLNNK